MKQSMRKIVKRHGVQLCALARATAVVAKGPCKVLYHQPQEPEGLQEFASGKMHREKAED